MSKLYASVAGVNNIISADISTSHSNSVSTAQIICESSTIDIGDYIAVDLGYTTNHKVIFRGYVKGTEKSTPNSLKKIIANDVLVRAVDYFIVSSDPEDPFTRSNIRADRLIRDVLELAGLTNFDFTNPQFTFATTADSKVEVNLTSAYDFSKMIADLLAWNLWAEEDGVIYFRNRKPYVMDGTSGQVGDVADSILKTIWTKDILDFEYRESDRELRNKIVLYGAPGINAESSSATSYVPRTDSMEQVLPTDFYKTSVLASEFIADQSQANNACDYNLALYNRVTTEASVNIVGDPDLLARKVIHVNENNLGINSDWYIYTADHSWTRNGYVTSMELRQ